MTGEGSSTEPSTVRSPGAKAAGLARVDRFLTPDRLLVYPSAILVLFLVFWVASVPFVGPLPDFVARWTAGTLLLDGRSSVLYEPGAQSAIQQALGSAGLSWFVSPPYVAMVFAPFALVPYPVAALLWTGVSLSLLWAAARSLVALDPAFAALDRWRALLLAASCQVVLELLGSGQDTAVVLAAFVLAARVLASGREVLAGLLLSLAAIKPQLVILVPFVLVWRRAWGVLIGFVGGGVALVGVSAVALGPGLWETWLRALSSPLYRDEVIAGQTSKNTSLHGLLEHLVPGRGWPATALWVVGVLVVVVVTVWNRQTVRALPLPIVLVTVVPLTTVLVSPHAMVYDLVVVYPAVLWLLATRPSARLRGLVAVGFVLLFLSPFLQLVAGELPVLSVLAAPWVVVVLLALWWGWLGGGGGPERAASGAAGPQRGAVTRT